MTALQESAPHLSDEEIDLYWTGRLSDERQRGLEQHYLACPSCLDRVRAVEALIASLQTEPRPRRTWPSVLSAAAAAGLAALSLGLLHEVQQLRVRLAAAQRRPPPAPSQPAAIERPAQWVILELEPALRGATVREVRVPPATSHVSVSVAAGEVAPPGATFDVAVIDPTARPIAQFAALRSGPDGRITFPLVSGSLRLGDHVVEVHSGREVVQIPFRVVP